MLRRSWELLTERADDLARLITLENGKVLAEAKGEITYAAEFFRWFSEEAVRLTGDLTTAPGGANRILVRPPAGRGRLPRHAVELPGRHGHAQDRPRARGRLRRRAEAGHPHAAHRAGGGRRAGRGGRARRRGQRGARPQRQHRSPAAVLEHERVRKLSFTGSTEVGKLLIEQAAGRVLNVSMELGGNAPFIVLADADLDAAIEGAMIAKMRHNGETCTAANRFYVEAPVADAFAAKLADAMGALPDRPRARRRHPPRPARRRRHPRQGRRAGRRRRGRRGQGHRGRRAPAGHRLLLPRHRPHRRSPPTTRSSPRRSSDRWRRSCAVADADEAVRLANGTTMGLVAYVYTGDLAKGLRVAEALESGMVGLNKGIVSDPAAPFGGVKESGIGREGGHEGMLDYTETKYIATDW